MTGIIDFTELRTASTVNQGEALEQLVRLLASNLDLHVAKWSGRGADNQMDLILVERRNYPFSYQVRWLVSCKDNAKSAKQTSELPNNLETRLRNLRANGFLLVTTTFPSASTKKLLDDMADNGSFITDVWDSGRLTQFLTKTKNISLFRQFFPNSYANFHNAPDTEDIAMTLEIFDAQTRLSGRSPGIPGLVEPIVRDEQYTVEKHLAHKKPVLLVGDAGVGKSGIAHILCTTRSSGGKPVLLLDARRLSNVRDIGDLPARIGSNGPLLHSIRQIAKISGCRLVIDQLDSTVNASASQAFEEIAIQCAREPNVEVVVISRQRESYERRMVQRLISEGNFVRIECGELSENIAHETLMKLEIHNPSTALVQTARNLLNLFIVAEIKRQQPMYNFSNIRDKTELWQGFVNVIQESEGRSPDPALGENIIAKATAFAIEGLQSDDRTFLVTTLNPEVQRMESWGIITADNAARYRFVHEEFQNFLYARDAVNHRYMPGDVVETISAFRVRSIFLWMERLYQPPYRARFLTELLNHV